MQYFIFLVQSYAQDIRELKAEKNPMIHAAPLPVLFYQILFILQDNMFEWHFTIQGPPESDYAGGIYHGRLLLPAEWPMKPPKIIFMTVFKSVISMMYR